MFSSALSLATVLVVGLNLLSRIGVAKCRTAEFIPNAVGNFGEITQLLQEQGVAEYLVCQFAAAPRST